MAENPTNLYQRVRPELKKKEAEGLIKIIGEIPEPDRSLVRIFVVPPVDANFGPDPIINIMRGLVIAGVDSRYAAPRWRDSQQGTFSGHILHFGRFTYESSGNLKRPKIEVPIYVKTRYGEVIYQYQDSLVKGVMEHNNHLDRLSNAITKAQINALLESPVIDLEALLALPPGPTHIHA